MKLFLKWRKECTYQFPQQIVGKLIEQNSVCVRNRQIKYINCLAKGIPLFHDVDILLSLWRENWIQNEKEKSTIVYAEYILTMQTLREHRIFKCHQCLWDFRLDISLLNVLNILLVWKTNDYIFHLWYGAIFVRIYQRGNDNENELTINSTTR